MKQCHMREVTRVFVVVVGYCARAVAAAIRAGGLKIEGADANDFWRSLEKAGFSKVYGNQLKVMWLL